MSFPSVVSVEVGTAANDKESCVHRTPLSPESIIKIPVKEEGYPGFGIEARDGSVYDTVVGCFEATAKHAGSSQFLGHRETKEDGTRGDYIWCTYKDGLDDVTAWGVGLSTLCKVKANEGQSGDAGQPRVGERMHIELRACMHAHSHVVFSLACSHYPPSATISPCRAATSRRLWLIDAFRGQVFTA